MVKYSADDKLRRLKERYKNYEIQLKKISETIREKKEDRKMINTMIDRLEALTEFPFSRRAIKLNKQVSIYLRNIINDKQEQETKLMETLSRIKNQIIPKFKERDSLPNFHQIKPPKVIFGNNRNNRDQTNAYVLMMMRMSMTMRKKKTIAEMTDEDIVKHCLPCDRLRARFVVHKLRHYLTLVQDTQGFDVDNDSFPGMFVGVTRIIPQAVAGGLADIPLDYFATFAISKYNNQHETEFEFINLVKTNALFTRTITLFITFLARDKNHPDDLLQTFQTKMNCSVLFPQHEHSCMFVRLKPVAA